MKSITKGLALALLTVIVLSPLASVADEFEGKQTNVVMMVCVIDDRPPHRIHVRSLSMNTTHAKMPLISTKTSCAQALHQLLTAGFKIIDSDLRGYFKFVLTRADKCRKRD